MLMSLRKWASRAAVKLAQTGDIILGIVRKVLTATHTLSPPTERLERDNKEHTIIAFH